MGKQFLAVIIATDAFPYRLQVMRILEDAPDLTQRNLAKSVTVE